MIKVEVIEEFTLQKFDELKNIVRKGKEEKGRLFVGDIFECDKDMAEYLTGNNPLNKTVVKVIEVIPEEAKTKENAPKEKQEAKVQATKKTTTKKTTAKKTTTKKKED